MEIIEIVESSEEDGKSGPPRYLFPPQRPIRQVRLLKQQKPAQMGDSQQRAEPKKLSPHPNEAIPTSHEESSSQTSGSNSKDAPRNSTHQSSCRIGDESSGDLLKSSLLMSSWKEIEDQLRCDICKQLLDVPVSLKCFHTFCSFCIRRYLELSGNDYCPSCRIPATSTDIRLEPRLAGILNVLSQDRGGTRKRIRHCLRRERDQAAISSRNETFNKQADLRELFSSNSSVVGRTLLPLYKNLKDKALRELVSEDGLDSLLAGNPPLSRDELIKQHKEFIFTLQSAHDALRMGIYTGDKLPTKAALAKVFNNDYRLRRRGGILGTRKEPLESDSRKEQVADLTREASCRMMDQLRSALIKRRRKEDKASE